MHLQWRLPTSLSPGVQTDPRKLHSSGSPRKQTCNKCPPIPRLSFFMDPPGLQQSRLQTRMKASCGAPVACVPPCESGPSHGSRAEGLHGNTPSLQLPSRQDFFWGQRLLGDVNQIQNLIKSRTGELVGSPHHHPGDLAAAPSETSISHLPTRNCPPHTLLGQVQKARLTHVLSGLHSLARVENPDNHV